MKIKLSQVIGDYMIEAEVDTKEYSDANKALDAAYEMIRGYAKKLKGP